MYTLIFIIILIILILVIRMIHVIFKDKITFFISGMDAGFSLSDLFLLWNVSKICELKDPISLFYSKNALSKCMTKMSAISGNENKNINQNNQKLLSKLFDYRTKLQNETDEKKGIATTRDLDKGQKIRIVLPGKGIFTSQILSVSNDIIISIPKLNNTVILSADDWVGNKISVYFWRKGDARYVFDTIVLQSGFFLSEISLSLKHSANLLRTQKRKSVRVKCKIPGKLFIIKKDNNNHTAVETKNGYKCLIQDISESGALIKIGGKGIANINIKLQFEMNNKLIIMFGIIRTVEFYEEKKQSLLHFECTNIEPFMKNEILSFVYNTIPNDEKEEIEALEQTELDVSGDEQNINVSEIEKKINSEVINNLKTDESDNKSDFIVDNKENKDNNVTGDFSSDDIEDEIINNTSAV